MTRRLAALAAAPLLLLAVAVPAVLAAPELAVSPPQGQPGDQMTAYAVGFTPGTTITLVWNAKPDAVLATATADDSGGAVILFRIPTDETAGAAVVRACGGNGGCAPGTEFADTTVDVLPAKLVDEEGGGTWVPLLLIALIALVLGQVTRRRWTRTTATFKPPPRKTHDHELEQPPPVGRPPWQDRDA